MIMGFGIYHLRYKLDVSMVYICATIGVFYMISKYFEIIIYHLDEWVFLFMIFFGFALIAINYRIFDTINLEIKKAQHD